MVDPYFPFVMEAEACGPDSDHAPAVEEDDADCDGVEHGFCAEVEMSLDIPEGVNADCLEGAMDVSD